MLVTPERLCAPLEEIGSKVPPARMPIKISVMRTLHLSELALQHDREGACRDTTRVFIVVCWEREGEE